MSIDVNKLIEDKKFVEYAINRTIPLSQMFKQVGYEFSDEHNVYCPFHENEDTPAGKIYHNDDGIDTLFCFSERKVFKAVDFIKKEIINTRVETIFYKVWRQLTEEQQQYLVDSYANIGESLNVAVDFTPYEEDFKKFKKGAISYKDICSVILEALK